MPSFRHIITILLLLVQTITFAQGVGVDSVQVVNVLPDTCFNNTIADSVKLKSVPFETIRREDDKYFAVTSDNKDVEITSMINGKTRALVQDGDGHENDTLNLTIGTTGKQAIYAYDADSVIVGKLCIQAYDPKEVKSPPMAMGTQEAYSRMIQRRGRNIRIVYAQ